MNNNKALSDLYPFLNENKKGVNTELLLASIQEKVSTRGYWVHKFGGNMCCIAR
jgi:hypothetical protein